MKFLMGIMGGKEIPGTFQDITERKGAELKLAQSEEKTRALIENISDIIILLDRDAKVIFHNSASICTSCFEQNDIMGKAIFDVIHPMDRRNMRLLFHKVLTRVGVPFQSQCRIMHKSGHYFWVEGSIVNMLGNDSVKGIVINYRDISERKKFEEQQQLLTSIVNCSEDAIISKSLDGTITSWNRGAESILGYSSSETIGNSIKMIIPSNHLAEEDKILEQIDKCEALDHYETVRKRKDGKHIYVSLTVSPIVDSAGKIIGASKILRDISNQKQLEFEREKTLNELLLRNRVLEQFSYIVSHNLREPVASIMGLSNVLQNTYMTWKEKKEFIKGIDLSAQQLDVVLRDLNTILSIREINEKKETVNLLEMVADISISLNRLMVNENVQLICNFDSVDNILTVKTYIYSIFHNLISNSIKYRQPKINPIIEITSIAKGNKTILCFKDNGLGINLNKKRSEVFGLYKRFHSHIGGKGLGLFMVKSHVESLGGVINIESEENVGTEFTIEFVN